jgi:hypothetical protein
MRSSKRWIGFAVAVIAVALGVWTANNWKRFRPYDWEVVESPDAQFRISFPGNPTASQEIITASEDGSKFVSYKLASSPPHGVIYSLNWWESPVQNGKSTDELFANFRDCYIKVFHGKIVSENEVRVQGYPAEDTEVLAPNGLVVANRVIRVGPRIYSVWVVDSTGHLDSGNIQKFLGSLSFHRT